jgi:hypothetical protein
MEMVQLNDLLPPEKWEMNWTILGHQHEELSDDKEYVIFEHYCPTPDCYCQKLVADIREMGPDGEPLGKSAAVISYDWSSDKTRCHAALLDTSPMTKTALSLLEVYEKHIHQDEYLARIKTQYAKVKELAIKNPWEQAINPNRDISRNDLCPCGSNKKFKKCCLNR